MRQKFGAKRRYVSHLDLAYDQPAIVLRDIEEVLRDFSREFTIHGGTRIDNITIQFGKSDERYVEYELNLEARGEVDGE